MKNRDIYQRDPGKITLLNNGVAKMTDALTDDERRTLRFELEHFVCEGEYQGGLVRILDSYVSNQGQPEQPAAWVSGLLRQRKVPSREDAALPVDRLHLPGRWSECAGPGSPADRCTGRAHRDHNFGKAGRWPSRGGGDAGRPAPAGAFVWRCLASCSSQWIFPKAIRRRVSAFGSRRTASTSRSLLWSRPRGGTFGANLTTCM